MLSPSATLRIANAIVGEETPYCQTIAAGRAAIDLLKNATREGKLPLSRKEQQWLTRIESALDELPPDEYALLSTLEEQYGSRYDKASYEL